MRRPNIKSVVLMVNNYCNSRCSICNIWQNINHEELSIKDLQSLFSLNEFREVEEINLNGGEPMLRQDIHYVIGEIIRNNPKLKRIIFTTNGTRPKKTEKIINIYANAVPEFILHVSIEGNRETHNIVRGIDSYSVARETLIRCGGNIKGGYKQAISTTLVKENCNYDNLNHLRELARETGSFLTFRFATISESYFNNKNQNELINYELSEETIRFLDEECEKSKFLKIQRDFQLTGKIPIMLDGDGRIKCKAGKNFAFVKSNGAIYPCVLSNRIIGNIHKGIRNIGSGLGKYEPCPCCTEAHIYPMLKYESAI